MTQNCYSMRPGTIFGYKGESWRVVSNDTLRREFEAKSKQSLSFKTFRYPDSNEIQVRWVPFA